ncbi:GyrI-like domain-containing protein [Sporosarcina sp. ITBMC105]
MSHVHAKEECEIVTKEFKFVGISMTAPFPSGFPEAAMKVQQQFEKRMLEVENYVDRQVLCSPYVGNGIVTTYFACLEVTTLEVIPEEMIGFTIPTMQYAKTTCTNKTIVNGYDKIFQWIKDNGYTPKGSEVFHIERFHLDEQAAEEQVELLIPIH